MNSLNAACEADYVPETIYLLTNPKVADLVDPINDRAQSIVSTYGREQLDVRVTNLDEETDFAGIVEHYRDAIEEAHEQNDQIAVDVTPGRKYMSAFAFQAGIEFGAYHVFYLLVDSNRYYDLIYPEIPRSSLELIDFAEVFE